MDKVAQGDWPKVSPTLASKPVRTWRVRLTPGIELAAVFLAAALFRMVILIRFPSIARPDEIFQNAEPAFRMVTGHGIVTWEWIAAMRSPILPAVLSQFMREGFALGAPLSAALPLAWIATCAMASTVVTAAAAFARARFGRSGLLIVGTAGVLSPDLAYFGARTLGEVQGGNLLLLAALACEGLASSATSTGRWQGAMRGALAGLLAGLGVDLRIQLAPVALLLLVALALFRPNRTALGFAAGLTGAIALGGWADAIWWGAPFLSTWNNIKVNLLEHAAAEFGTAPWYWYAGAIVRHWGAGLILVLPFAWRGCREVPILATTALVVLGSHSLIAHKEYSFVYAGIGALTFTCAFGFAAWQTERSNASAARRTAMAALVATLCLLTTASTYFDTYWQSEGDVLKLQKLAARDPALCGLGLQHELLGWYDTGGDVLVGRDVPMYHFGEPAGPEHPEALFNYAIGGTGLPDRLAGFRIVTCSAGVGGRHLCLGRRDGPCRPDPQAAVTRDAAKLGRPGTPD